MRRVLASIGYTSCEAHLNLIDDLPPDLLNLIPANLGPSSLPWILSGRYIAIHAKAYLLPLAVPIGLCIAIRYNYLLPRV